MAEPGPRLFTVADIATALRVSNMTIYRMINADVLPAVKIGRSLRVTEHHLREFLEHSPTHDGDPQAILESIFHVATTMEDHHQAPTGSQAHTGPASGAGHTKEARKDA